MIWHPQPGQSVEIRYGRAYQHQMPHHSRSGAVSCVSAGPGPRNALILFSDGHHAIIPRGNLFRIPNAP